MKPLYEHVHLSPGESWRLYIRHALSLPFVWHYHPEFELTLTENVSGLRYVGVNVQPFESGDLVFIGLSLIAVMEPPMFGVMEPQTGS